MKKAKSEFKRRKIEELYSDTLISSVYGEIIPLDFIEEPYTMVSFARSEETEPIHLDIMRIILRDIDKETFKVDLRADKLKEHIPHLLLLKLIVESGLDYENDIDFKTICCYSFIESVENKGDMYTVTVTKGFYENMNKYFYDGFHLKVVQ